MFFDLGLQRANWSPLRIRPLFGLADYLMQRPLCSASSLVDRGIMVGISFSLTRHPVRPPVAGGGHQPGVVRGANEFEDVDGRVSIGVEHRGGQD
jgi:hypothetical protein